MTVSPPEAVVYRLLIKIYQTDYLMSDLLEKHSLFKSWIKNSNELMSTHFAPTSLTGHIFSAGLQESERLVGKLEMLKTLKAGIDTINESKTNYANAIATIGVQEQLDSNEYMDCLLVQMKK